MKMWCGQPVDNNSYDILAMNTSCHLLSCSCIIRRSYPRYPGIYAACKTTYFNIASPIAKAAGEVISLPKSGGGRPACLTVADCGQIAGVLGVFRNFDLGFRESSSRL